jgi:hypothetical protein
VPHRRNQRAPASEKAGFYKPGTLVKRLRHAPKQNNPETWEEIPISQYGVGVVVRECEDIYETPTFRNHPFASLSGKYSTREEQIKTHVEVFWQGTGTREVLHKKYVGGIPKVERIVSHNVSASSDTESKDK